MFRWKEQKTNKPVARSAWAKAHPPKMTKLDRQRLESHLDVMTYGGQYIEYRWFTKEEYLDKLENSYDSLA